MSRPDPPEQLVVINDRGSRCPLFCIHPIGGYVDAYDCLEALLGDDQPIYAVGSRALLAPTTEYPTIAAMGAGYAAVVQATQPRGPYRLFGWSMGALTAHEVACDLERRGETVEFLGMVDPQVGLARPTRDDLRIAISMAIQIFHPTPPLGATIRSNLRLLDVDKSNAGNARWCIEQGLLPEGAPELAFDSAVQLFFVHRTLLAEHTPAVCRSSVVVWKARDVASRAPHDWSRHTTGTCTINDLGSDHFAIMRSPHIDAIAAQLRRS